MPDYPIPVPGLPDGQLILRQGALFESRFLLNGKRLKAKRRAVEVAVGAQTVHVALDGGPWDFYREPAVVLDGRRIVLAERLPALLFGLAMLPVALILGGALGAVFCVLASMVNAGVVRARWSVAARAAVLVGVAGLALAGYLLAVFVVVAA